MLTACRKSPAFPMMTSTTSTSMNRLFDTTTLPASGPTFQRGLILSKSLTILPTTIWTVF